MKASCSQKKKRKGKTFTLEEIYLNLQCFKSDEFLVERPTCP